MFTDVFSLPIRNHFERLRPVRGFLLCIGFQHTSQTSWNKCFGSLVLSNVITCLTVRSVGAECNAFYKSLFIKVFIQNLFWSDFLGDIVEKAVLKWPLPNHRYCAFNIKIIGKVVLFFVTVLQLFLHVSIMECIVYVGDYLILKVNMHYLHRRVMTLKILFCFYIIWQNREHRRELFLNILGAIYGRISVSKMHIWV